MGSFWLAEAVQALIDMTSWSWKIFGGDSLGGDILGGDSLGGNNFGDDSFCGDSFGGDSLCGDSHPWWCYRCVCSCIYWWTRSYGLTAVRLSVHLSIYPSIRLWSRLTLMDVLKMASRPLIYWRTHCISPAISSDPDLCRARAQLVPIERRCIGNGLAGRAVRRPAAWVPGWRHAGESVEWRRTGLCLQVNCQSEHVFFRQPPRIRTCHSTPSSAEARYYADALTNY